VQTYKAFQLSDDGDLNTEIRTRFSEANLPYVGRVDVRTYYGPTGPADSLVGQSGEFNILPNTWTRYWVFLDYDNDTFSLWVGDDQRAPVVLYDRAPYNMSGNEINQFWFEYNTSQNRNGPLKYVWGRNLAILRNV